MAALANFVGFQLVWFSAVLGAGAGLGALGPIAVACFAGATLIGSSRIKGELQLLAVLIFGGWAADTALLNLGLVGFNANAWAPMAPPWIVALWANFGLTLNRSLSWLQGRPLVAAAFGAIGGPLAYIAGSALGAATFPRGTLPAAIALAVVWAVAAPLTAAFAANRSSN